MAAILFDASLPCLAPVTFGLGVLPPAPAPPPRAPRLYDEIGNKIPFGPSDADRAWYAADLQRRMDAAAEADELAREMEAMRLAELEAEWLASIEWPEQGELNAGRCRRF